MGQFSWIYSDTGEPVYNDERADTYLLVPKEFQKKYGHAIYEPWYEGYGRFGGYDVYDLIIEWNKEMIPEIIAKAKKMNGLSTFLLKWKWRTWKTIILENQSIANFVFSELSWHVIMRIMQN